MADAPPANAVRVQPDAPPVTPASDTSSAGPPPGSVAVKAPPAGSIPVASAKKPSSPAVQAVKDVPKDIWHDIHSGFESMKEGWKGLQNPENSPWGDIKAAGEYAGGAAEMVGSPLTGSVRALFTDPLRKVIPQDNPAGKMVVNAAEDAVLMFGPEAIGPFVKSIKTAPGSVKRLLEGGVTLTPGQLNPMFAKRAEEAARSLPLVGSFLRKAYERTLDSFNVQSVKRVAAPLGDIGDAKNGREAMTKAHDLADREYAQVRANIHAVERDPEMIRDSKILRMELSEGDPVVQRRIENFIDNRMEHKWDTQFHTMSGQDFKALESELTTQISANRYGNEQNKDYAKRLEQIRTILREGIERQYPDVADQLKQVNAVYARLADIDYAQSRTAGNMGRFTPADYLAGIKRQDKSPRHVKFNEGTRPAQEWAEDAHQVIGNKLPDSGTSERAGWAIAEGGFHGGALGAGAFFGNPYYLGALGGTAAAYSRPGQRAISDLALNAGPAAKKAGGVIAKAAPVGAVTRQAEGQK